MPKLEDRIAELEAAVSTARRGEEIARTEQALAGKVNPSMLEAVALLLVNRGSVRRLNDALIFRSPGMPLDLSEGVAAWTKSPEAKDFLPRPRVLAGRERAREAFLSGLRRVSDGDTFELRKAQR